MPNSLNATATVFQQELDKVTTAGVTTAWMDTNAKMVKYEGGAEIKIPKMSVQGLGDYSRSTGYVNGTISTAWETRTLTQDRGRSFKLDPMDVDESNFVVTATAVMGEFQRLHTVPEIDAYRISKLASAILENNDSEKIEYGYTPSSSNILGKIMNAAAKLSDAGYNGQIACHMTHDVYTQLVLDFKDNLGTTTLKTGDGVELNFKSLNDIVFIPTPASRMYTAIEMLDGSTSQEEEGGYVPFAASAHINFVMAPINGVIGVIKHAKMKIFSPDVNQTSDDWLMNYRVFHDCWIKDNVIPLCVINIKESYGSLTLSSSAGTNSGKTAITVTESKGSGNIYKYKVGEAAESTYYGEDVSSWTTWDGSADITAATGKKLTLVEATSDGYARKVGSVTVTAHA